MNEGRIGRNGSLVLAIVVAVSLLISTMLFAVLAMGECLPRDGSAAMQACDTAKEMEFWLFPTLVLLFLLLAALLSRKRRGWGIAAILVAPFGAMVLLNPITAAVT